MNILKVKKLHPNAALPTQAHDTDSGYDIVALEDGKISEDGRYVEYQTGIAIAPTTGYHILIHPRSSISKYDLVLANSIGLVDQDYRGQVMCRFKIVPPYIKPSEFQYDHFVPKLYVKGDKIAQLVIEKTEHAKIQEVTDLDETVRGAGGFGSTGEK